MRGFQLELAWTQRIKIRILTCFHKLQRLEVHLASGIAGFSYSNYLLQMLSLAFPLNLSISLAQSASLLTSPPYLPFVLHSDFGLCSFLCSLQIGTLSSLP